MTLCELDIDYAFSDAERAAFQQSLQDVTLSPFRFYEAFRRQVRSVVDKGGVPERFVEFCRSLAALDRAEHPVVMVRNTPFDEGVPVFDADDPVASKYLLKTSFTAESFMESFAYLCRLTGIGNLDIAQGDVYNDIYPRRSSWQTQSSKGLLAQPFHKDLGNQPVVPDRIHMLAMRSDERNQVYTAFARNVDILRQLSASEKALLREPLFHTPSDPATTHADFLPETAHAVLTGSCELRFIEGRTRGNSAGAEELARKMDALPHTHKRRVFLRPGDFIALSNNLALHAREVHALGDEVALRSRWIIKSAVVEDTGSLGEHRVAQTDYLVAG
ncbi:hypothetical protein LG634_19350 [Streptomyces bambusae]|uniref:hypothetical protein n=1 Tax=Streptomyces bambusae TaxID=1550616 RepID=UPI001CFE30D7|nr:hypothetical protein [Streptomyces bambusae]MCB5166987.1 hypothetical protein [Streptomyces bambusae]